MYTLNLEFGLPNPGLRLGMQLQQYNGQNSLIFGRLHDSYRY